MTTEESFDQKPAAPQDEQQMQMLATLALQQATARKRARDRWRYVRNWPFPLKLGLATTLICFIPFVCALLITGRYAAGLVGDSQAGAHRDLAATTAKIVGNVIGSDVLAMEGFAASPTALKVVHDAASQPVLGSGIINPLASLAPIQQESIYITSSDGRVIALTIPALVGHAAPGDTATQAMAGNEPVAALGQAPVSAQAALTVAVPILRDKKVVGSAIGAFDPSSLYLALNAGSASSTASDMLLTSRCRTVTGHTLPPGSSVLLAGGSAAVSPACKAAFGALQSGRPIQLADGAWAAAVPGATGFVLLTPIYPSPQTIFDNVALRWLLAALAALAIYAIVRVTMSFSRPISAVARALAAVCAGNYDTRVGLDRDDEVGQIAQTVDMLVARTQDLVRDLDNQRVELENGIIQLFTELSEAASGDLTVRPTLSEGSLGAVADSARIVLERFKTTVQRIQATAAAVSSGTSAMTAAITQVSQEAQKEAAQLTASAEAIMEMAESAESVNQRTHAATEVGAQAVDAVSRGNNAVTFARDAVRRTTETARKVAREVKTLGESAQLMGSALLLVQHNTEELHMIAGNASIEAARYADNGGIFRTVADSIEQLAQQSQTALRQIQTVIENTQRETSHVVAAIDNVTGEVSAVDKAVNRAGESFDTISQTVQHLTDLNIFIAGASEQQALMAAKVARMISSIEQVSVQMSRHTAASAEDAMRLRKLTEELNDSVVTLKVS